MFNEAKITHFNQLETPFYYYDLALLRQTLEACSAAALRYGFHVNYALKANFNPRILKPIKEFGFGADCVSANEVNQAFEMGIDPKKIVFAGVGKTDKEISRALALDIFCFNVESIQEIEVINLLAGVQNKVADVALRINPNVDAVTHQHITTGLEENKFGMNLRDLPLCLEVLERCPYIKCIGIHFHIGSQITSLEVFKTLCIKVNEIHRWLESHGLTFELINVGGGLGIDYHQPDEQPIVDFDSYFNVFNRFLERSEGQKIHFELGRALVASCGSLISRVLYVKSGIKKNFLILDAGMTELMRPVLYQAYHKIQNLTRPHMSTLLKYDVVGPICESTDCFGKEVELPESQRGDLIAIRSAGAYGEVMASRYNLRDEVRTVFSE